MSSESVPYGQVGAGLSDIKEDKDKASAAQVKAVAPAPIAPTASPQKAAQVRP